MKASVRCNALTLSKLREQEKHGKRDDWSSQRRMVRKSAPIVGGGLDLVELLQEHTKGTTQNKAAKNVALHFIVKFPQEVLDEDAAPTPFQNKTKRERQQVMARQAVKFIQDTHGGQAVFAYRVDTDEAGEWVVDVFACPKYEKATKKETKTWTSLTKFGKALALEHQDEIRRRSPDHKGPGPITSPRAIGMSMQSEFAAFFHRVNGQPLTPKTEKNSPAPDRLGVEEWKLKMLQTDQAEAQELAAAAADDAKAAQAEASKVRATVKAEKGAFRKQAREWVNREKTAIQSVRAQANEDRKKAAAELLTARTALDRLKDTYAAVRASLPRIRQILTWDLATEDETRRAKVGRRQAVKISPILRNAIRDAQAVEGTSGAAEKTSPDADMPDGLSI